MNITYLKKPIYSSITKKSVTLLLFFSIFFVPQLSFAINKTAREIVSVKYIPGWKDKNMYLQGAIQFTLSPGWKTYWKRPGPFGIRPVVDWSQSENIQNIRLLWPTPKIFYQSDIRVIGYEGVLTIPVRIIKIDSLKDALLNIKLEFGICSEICLLKTAKIIVPLEVNASDKNFDVINKALKKVPIKVIDQVFSISQCAINRNGKDLNLAYSINLSKNPISKPTVIIDYASSEQYIENQTMEINGKTLLVKASLTNIHKEEGLIERSRLTTLLILENKGFEIRGCS